MNYKKLIIYIAEGLGFLGLAEDINREENYIDFKLKNSNKHFTIRINEYNELKIYMKENNIDVKSFNINEKNKIKIISKIKNIIKKEK